MKVLVASAAPFREDVRASGGIRSVDFGMGRLHGISTRRSGRHDVAVGLLTWLRSKQYHNNACKEKKNRIG